MLHSYVDGLMIASALSVVSTTRIWVMPHRFEHPDIVLTSGVQALIGGTILSWGETVPELVATYTLAKMGHSTMAIAGCFAGPVFNLMMGLGLPVLYSSLKHGALVMELTSGIITLVIQSVLVLATLVVAVPLVFKWRLYQQIGFGLLGVYVLFQLLFVLVEDGVFW